MQEVFRQLHLKVLQRDWLSSNNIVFADPAGGPAAVVDTSYHCHAEQTVALIGHVLGARPLATIVNTHLHSDHCGGNAALQARWPQVQTLVPQGAWDMAQQWDEERLSFRLTDQRCDPFRVDACLVPGQAVELGGRAWQLHATGGHDPDAVVLFEPSSRVLISGDTLWRDRVAVIFPELDDQPGFGPALAAMDLIESLAPRVVIPGHGEPFTEVADALRISRERLTSLQARPERHARHAARVLLMFNMMERRRRPLQELRDWLALTPLLQRPRVQQLLGMDAPALSASIVEGLLTDGALKLEEGQVVVA